LFDKTKGVASLLYAVSTLKVQNNIEANLSFQTTWPVRCANQRITKFPVEFCKSDVAGVAVAALEEVVGRTQIADPYGLLAPKRREGVT